MAAAEVRSSYLSARVAAEHGVVADVVISLQASRPELISRLLARTAAEERADDVPEVIEHRLRLFDAGIGPMLDSSARGSSCGRSTPGR